MKNLVLSSAIALVLGGCAGTGAPPAQVPPTTVSPLPSPSTATDGANSDIKKTLSDLDQIDADRDEALRQSERDHNQSQTCLLIKQQGKPLSEDCKQRLKKLDNP